jgi:hypothetical protein|tara:strand:+ start:11763 stop:12065 length:303 start_codon:yes stop_codon:yes gene_type:complete
MIGKLSLFATWIHPGPGYVIGQKHQPLQTENGIKVNHVHIHALQRTKLDDQQQILFPFPRTSDDFEKPISDTEKILQADDIQRIKHELETLHERKSKDSS